MYILLGLFIAWVLVASLGQGGVIIGLGLAIGLGIQAWDRSHRPPDDGRWENRPESERIARKMDAYAEDWRKEHPTAPDQKD